MKVKDLIEQLKTMNPDAPIVVHGFLGGFDDVEFIKPVSLACDVYESETWRGKHELLDTLKRYQEKILSSRTASSDLRRLITAIDGGTAKLDMMNAVCLSGISNLPMPKSADAEVDDSSSNVVETVETDWLSKPSALGRAKSG